MIADGQTHTQTDRRTRSSQYSALRCRGRSNHRLCCIILYRAGGERPGREYWRRGAAIAQAAAAAAAAAASACASLRRSSLTRTDSSAVAVAPSIDAERRGRALRRSFSLSLRDCLTAGRITRRDSVHRHGTACCCSVFLEVTTLFVAE